MNMTEDAPIAVNPQICQWHSLVNEVTSPNLSSHGFYIKHEIWIVVSRNLLAAAAMSWPSTYWLKSSPRALNSIIKSWMYSLGCFLASCSLAAVTAKVSGLARRLAEARLLARVGVVGNVSEQRVEGRVS
jgi:hypothetical protein